MKLITYVINLDDNVARMQEVTRQMTALQWPFTRVSAFDGRKVDPHSISDYDEARALAYMGRTLKGGELGCYFSHLDCAQRFLASDADYAIVLEDDMHIKSDALEVIQQSIGWLKAHNLSWYLMHIASEKRKITTRLQQFAGCELLRAHYFPVTTTGLVWSRQGAQSFVNEHDKIFAPVDNYFRWWLTNNDKGLTIYPPLVLPSGAQSDINSTSLNAGNLKKARFFRLNKQRRLWGDKLKALSHKWLK